MGELIQSLIRFSMDLSAFAFRQMANLVGPGQSAGAAAGPSSSSVPASGRKPDASPKTPSRAPARSGRLNTRNFMVLGEGLSAGVGDFQVNEFFQRKSFPAQMAEAMGVDFRQALIQEPGIGNLPGFPPTPVSVPAEMQTTFLSDLFAAGPRNDLSIPGLSVSDCVELRSRPPLVCQRDARQTVANFVLGMPGFATSGHEGLTQLEYAVRNAPTFAMVALGFHEALSAAIQGDANLLPEVQGLLASFTRILRMLKDAGCEVMVMNIPDPLDTAWFNSVECAGKVLRADPEVLRMLYHPGSDDLITLPGLVEIGNQILGKSIGPLSPEHVLHGGVATQITSWVNQVNRELSGVAAKHGALCHDLHGFIRNMRTMGCSLCPRSITGEFLGGFYSLNGFYPGPGGNAILANDVLAALNRFYGAEFPMIDACRVMRGDPVAMYEPAKGPVWTAAHLSALQQAAMSTPVMNESPQLSIGQSPPGPTTNLRLPDGLEQVLPLSFDSSYIGEAIRAVNCQDEQTAIYGSSPSPLFGGPVLTDSHLRGNVRIRFTPPVNDITRFEVTFEGGLTGNDSTLAAPNLYRFPFQQNSVGNFPGQPCSGTLNLATGEVDPGSLKFSFAFANTGLFALAKANPRFPKVPITFPGTYGTAFVSFEQRSDGKLDFSFYGTTFLPLWQAVGPMRLPLPFAGPTLEFATVPANGTAMHPHIRLSTRSLVDLPAPVSAAPVTVPSNTIQEYTLFTHNSCFGDHFSLNIPEFGGDATGRSQLMGRLRLQFGERSANSVPVTVSLMISGGALYPMRQTPISQAFPGRLSPGPHGFDEYLRFPLRTYALDTVLFFDDPFDLSIGAVDVNTGQFIGGLLHRGFLAQDVFFALLRVEPRTPRSSFLFAGPASLAQGRAGQSVFRLQSNTRIPYPEGFLFPSPDLATGYVVGPGSFLEPYLWVRAIGEPCGHPCILEGGEAQVLASNGNTFSYRYGISNGPGGPQFFEYINHSQDGGYRLHTVIWVKFMNSVESESEGSPDEYDTLTFAGFGTWSKGGVEKTSVVTVQISNAPGAKYVGIQVEGGEISDVNTKPPLLSDATP
jgi:hypothetical protein